MKKIFAIALSLILTVGMFTACGKIEDDVSSVANNDISKSEKVDSIASQGSNDNLLTENNQTAENLYYVVTKAADDLSKGQFDGITASKDIEFGEYRITIDKSAELPYSLKYAANGSSSNSRKLSEDETKQFLNYAISKCDIQNGEVIIRIASTINQKKELYAPRQIQVKMGASVSSTTTISTDYIYKIYYSDSPDSKYIGCNSPKFETVSDFTIDNIPDNKKSEGYELQSKNNIIAQNISRALDSSIRDINNGKFQEISGAKNVQPGEYRISLDDSDGKSIDLSDNDKNGNNISADGVKSFITYVVKNQNCLTRYVSCKAVNNGELVVRIIKRNIKSTDSNKENYVLYSVIVFYSDSQQSLYTGNSNINNSSKEDFYKISDIPQFVDEYECDIDENQMNGYSGFVN